MHDEAIEKHNLNVWLTAAVSVEGKDVMLDEPDRPLARLRSSLNPLCQSPVFEFEEGRTLPVANLKKVLPARVSGVS